MVILNETKYILSIGVFVWLATTVKGQWLVDDLGCRTPDGGSGSCIPIAHCKHVTDIIRNSTKTASLPQHIINEIRSYHCGDTNNSVKVCCPTNPIERPKIKLEQPTIIELPSDDTCATPNRDVGTCIAIDKCKPITDFIRKSSPLSRTAIDMLKGYQCGPITSKVTVCCPKNEISLETPAIPDNECQTPDENIGSCIPIKECNHVTDFFHNSWPLSQNSFKLLKSYECRHQNSVNVCCPNHPILIQSVTQKLPSIIEEPHRGDTCITPDDHTGFCIPIKTCKRITDFINNSSPLSPEVIEFLQGYQCGNTTNPLNVCCPNIPISMQTIREKSHVVANHENLKLLPEECGFQIASQRIIGGTKADLFEFPWMALLSYNTENGPSFKCGGTIINERYILTAAHCISTTKLKLIGVRVGEHYIFSQRDCEQQPFGDEVCAPPVQDLAIEEIIPHPKYNNITFINDIGLIRLASPIDTTVENAKPICLPITEELRTHNFTNTNLTVTGWGNTEAGHKSADLLKVSVPVIPEETCRKAYNNTTVLINKVKQICAGGKQKSDSCTGDSGGPLQMMLFYNYDIRSVQFGVVSFGPKRCGQEGIPGVYTKVDYYMDWILDNIKP